MYIILLNVPPAKLVKNHKDLQNIQETQMCYIFIRVCYKSLKSLYWSVL